MAYLRDEFEYFIHTRNLKPVYLCLSIIDLSKTAMYEFWYYVKLKYGEKVKLCYLETDSFIV